MEKGEWDLTKVDEDKLRITSDFGFGQMNRPGARARVALSGHCCGIFRDGFHEYSFVYR